MWFDMLDMKNGAFNIETGEIRLYGLMIISMANNEKGAGHLINGKWYPLHDTCKKTFGPNYDKKIWNTLRFRDHAQYFV